MMDMLEMQNFPVYLIPGRGDAIEDNLGGIIRRMGYPFQQREITPEFELLRFPEQLKVIEKELEIGFWRHDAILIGRSYGAYLLLHSLSEMQDFPGRILLFSPVLGPGRNRNGFYGSIPPRSNKLLQLAENNQFPLFQYLEIHTGTDDNGCNPLLAERFVAPFKNARLYLVLGAGHHLDDVYVSDVLMNFLKR
jgi:predicted esterase